MTCVEALCRRTVRGRGWRPVRGRSRWLDVVIEPRLARGARLVIGRRRISRRAEIRLDIGGPMKLGRAEAEAAAIVAHHLRVDDGGISPCYKRGNGRRGLSQQW